MTTEISFQIPSNRWDAGKAAELDEAGRLLYRSNLLGADLALTNFGGGNTSAKITEIDPLSGEKAEVLWVKGSGGDLGSMRLDGFATLYQQRLLQLENRYRGVAYEDEMVGLLAHCTFNLNPRAASIDTPLHAYLPFAHIDHIHPDAVIAVAASADSEQLTQRIYGDTVGWLGWRRPGFQLALDLRAAVAQRSGMRGLILAGHGMFAWGDSAEECYRASLDMVARAAEFLNDARKGRRIFGAAIIETSAAPQRQQQAALLLPQLRAALHSDAPKIGYFRDDDVVLEFVNSERVKELATIGTSCPDHFLRTKIKPLVIAADADSAAIASAVAAYRADYIAYYERCKRVDSPPLRDANPIVILIPGIGLATFAKDAATARIAAEFYINAINVMRGAETVSRYVGLDEQEAFDIEYWLLEEAKLKRMPPSKPLSGRIAYITGAAGGIGSATAQQLLAEGAVVMLVDRDAEMLEQVRAGFASRFGADAVRSAVVDVTDEQAVVDSFAATVREYGGVDIFVANAGIASAASIEETTLELWRKNYGVLVEGYFLTAREAFKQMKALGGSIVFIVSKNALSASPNTAAYGSAKAAELQLMRVLALEGGPHGIRVNAINPDAVLKGSRIWDGDWQKERAAAYNIEPSELQAHYRSRSLLKRDVLPEDIAKAVLFFASDASAKSTGNILNVDAGHAGAFPR
ncbi:MAG TPA: bifunctional rhamnulose-1-phosphate aldolase/short-chain dehydrogenase [Spongiibacteraceae bacterium]|nr:bifunctional rhamnulose-1-phosphate aldolase/short-chain dehydrogenase [Spongiibacteraceae bacterium]